MSAKSMAISAGLLITDDRIDVQHVRLGSGIPARLRRFTQFVKEALLVPHDSAGALAARLVALDGIRPSSLSKVQGGLPFLYVWRDFTHVEWHEEESPRTERRALSASTLFAINSYGSLGSAETNLIADLNRYLRNSKVYSKISPRDRIKELERDALCWWYQALPIALFFHTSGLQPLSAVSRLCLACEQTGLVPLAADLHVLDDPAGDTESCSELLDVAAMSDGADDRPVVIRQALDRLESAAAEPDAAALRRWVVEVLQLRFIAMQAGPVTSLLLAWLVDMCESGTLKSENPSKETPREGLHNPVRPRLAP